MSSPPSPTQINEETDLDANNDVNNTNNNNTVEIIDENSVNRNINTLQSNNEHAVETTNNDINEIDNYNTTTSSSNRAVEESETITEADNQPYTNYPIVELLNGFELREANAVLSLINYMRREETVVTINNNSNESPESVNMAHKEEEEEEKEEKEIVNNMEVLLCASCEHPIASNREILRARADDTWKDKVYCYELDLFENEHPVWAYSATNPSEVRFDVVRISPYVNKECHAKPSSSIEISKPNEIIDITLHSNNNEDVKLENTISSTNNVDCSGNNNESEVQVNPCITTVSDVKNDHNNDENKQINRVIYEQKFNDNISCVFTKGAYSSEHPFFVGYDWCFCHCINCGSFLGWGFAKHDKVVNAMKEIQLKEEHAKKEKENHCVRKKERKMKPIGNSNNNNDNDMEQEEAIASAAADAMRRYEENSDNDDDNDDDDDDDDETHTGAFNVLINASQTENVAINYNYNISNNNYNEEETEEESITEEQHLEALNPSLPTAIPSNEEEEHLELVVVNDNAQLDYEVEEEEDSEEEANNENSLEEWVDILQQTNDEKLKTITRWMEKIALQRKGFHTTPTPDFIGLIVTRCTGKNDFDSELFNKAISFANSTLTKNFVLTYFDREFRHLLNSLHDYRLTHILFHKFEMCKSNLLKNWKFCKELSDDNKDKATENSLNGIINNNATDNINNEHVNNEEETQEQMGSREEVTNESTNEGDNTPELPDRHKKDWEKKNLNKKCKELIKEEKETEAIDIWVKNAITELQNFFKNCLGIIDHWTANETVHSINENNYNRLWSLFGTTNLLALLSNSNANNNHDEHNTNNNENENENDNEENVSNDVDTNPEDWTYLQEGEEEERLMFPPLSGEEHQEHNLNINTNNEEDMVIMHERNSDDFDDENSNHTPLSVESSNDSLHSFEDEF